MFTGLVAAVGRIVSVKPLSGEDAGVRLSIDAGDLGLEDVAIGDSIAVQGACMTVIGLSARGFEVDVSRESLNRTVGLSREGEVNLEKSLGLGDKLGGHLVSGHVDGLGEILRFSDVGESRELVIAVPKALARFLAYKGSITVNGISLTVNRVEDTADGCEISINIIPHTQAVTTLRNVKAGDKVNLEIDMIARYVERMLSASGAVEGRAPAWL
ncbi:riboflavin synthase [Bordetella hinzii]|jgi:riboflavin synthase|uniref:Riboflavin synthase n=2 Tax=Bordetella hinzii TaxID=103855 RepID=A0AAN1RWR1_9BORD|nr:riboflavin synthase [Bordetella hinzii]AKQ57342.1 Riboflavin synthase [Bordetella hinzii]AKQ61808.1 Riboflavin synthase [Bordetella hinzii]AZW17255.1 riboflavin synthase [Bordetella hinzii]KCB22950.1 riboflavin synthase, alpha subunit [Bordetella hinzii OH87 BAL007II]KCB27693.1 riboflavin synthase, alpha subunit [Bordetella hinzii CA90 BAL1384]